jgi:hypothetical protein
MGAVRIRNLSIIEKQARGRGIRMGIILLVNLAWQRGVEMPTYSRITA